MFDIATFGKTTIGELTWAYATDTIWGSKFVLSENGELTKITAYTYAATGDRARFLVYDSNGNLKGETGTNTWTFGKVWDWEDYAFASPLALTAGMYWLLFFANSDGGEIFLRWDAGSAGQGGYKSQAWNGAPDPITFDGNEDRECSIYATYTPTAAPFVTHVRIH